MSEPESKLTSKTKDVIAIKIFKDSPGFTFQHIVNVMVAQLRMEVGKDLQDAMYQKQETLNAGHYLH